MPQSERRCSEQHAFSWRNLLMPGNEHKGQHVAKVPASSEHEARSRSWVKRPLVWIGTFATAVVTGVAVAVAINVANNVVPVGSKPQLPGGFRIPTTLTPQAPGELRVHAAKPRSRTASRSVQYAPYVAIRREAGFAGGCGSWIVTKPPQQISRPPSNDGGWEKWISQNSAIDASPWIMAKPTQLNSFGSTVLDVTIQGRSATPVVLTGMEFVALRRTEGPVRGGVVTNSCGGPMDGRLVEVDLDGHPIKIVASHPDPFPALPGEPWLAKPIRFPYSVTDTNGEVFKIIAYGRTDCVWYATLFWSVDGENGESIINDNGKPFETAPATRATMAYSYKNHKWHICRSPARLKCALHQ